MAVPFQADNDLRSVIVHGARRAAQSMDFRTGHAAGISGLGDPEVLALSARDGRILVTHDTKTMPTHFWEFGRSNWSPGVPAIPQRLPAAIAIESILLVWELADEREFENRLCLIPSLATIVYAVRD